MSYLLKREEQKRVGDGFLFPSKVGPHVFTNRESGTAHEEGGVFISGRFGVEFWGNGKNRFLYFLVSCSQFDILLRPTLNLGH